MVTTSTITGRVVGAMGVLLLAMVMSGGCRIGGNSATPLSTSPEEILREARENPRDAWRSYQSLKQHYLAGRWSHDQMSTVLVPAWPRNHAAVYHVAFLCFLVDQGEERARRELGERSVATSAGQLSRDATPSDMKVLTLLDEAVSEKRAVNYEDAWWELLDQLIVGDFAKDVCLVRRRDIYDK